MVKRAMVRAMRPTACSQLPSWRWSWAPRRHSQPEMAASGVMNRKHTMSQNSVFFSLRGPGSCSHCGAKGGRCFYIHREKAFPVRQQHQTSPERDAGVDLCYLCEGAGPALDAEVRVAQLAVAGVGGGKPPLQAALVHRAQRAGAAARRQEALGAASLVANTADGPVAEDKHVAFRMR